jgi:hypothetical protein
MKYYVPDVFRRNPMKRQMIMAGFAALVTLAAATVAAQTPPAAPAKAPAAPTPASCGPNPPAELIHAAKGSRCFEMRTYTFSPTGTGSVASFNTRFRRVVETFFSKHNITVIGVWQPVAKPDTFVYILAFKDAAAKDASWAAFQADPEWLKLRAEFNHTQTVVSEFMVAKEYSPIK